MEFKKHLAFILFALMLFACQEESSLPKPKAFLALEYPKGEYIKPDLDCPFSLKINSLSNIKTSNLKQACWFDIHYPKMKGSIYISYYPVDDNLKSLITDAQKLPLKHEIKADAILSQTFINQQNDTY